MKQNRDPRPVVAHVKSPFLYATETFIYGYLRAITHFRSVVVTGIRENADRFPWKEIIERRSLPGPFEFGWRGGRSLVGMLRPDDPMLAGFYRKALLELAPDLIHAHFGPTGLAVAPIAKEFGIPLVVSFYGADLGKYPRTFGRDMYARRRMFEIAARCTAEGPQAAGLLRVLGCPGEKASVVPIGVHIEKIPFRERRIDEGDPVRLLFCGRLVPKKGLDIGLQAFAKTCKGRPVILHVVGAGPEERKCRRWAEHLGVADQVCFRGSVTHDDFLDLCDRCHLLYVPSHTDPKTGDTEGGAPTVLLEGQASGLPVVATRHADIPHVVREGRSAFLAEEADPDSLADALEQALEAFEQWPEMGRAGRNHVAKRHSFETAGRELQGAYGEALIGEGNRKNGGE